MYHEMQAIKSIRATGLVLSNKLTKSDRTCEIRTVAIVVDTVLNCLAISRSAVNCTTVLVVLAMLAVLNIRKLMARTVAVHAIATDTIASFTIDLVCGKQLIINRRCVSFLPRNHPQCSR